MIGFGLNILLVGYHGLEFRTPRLTVSLKVSHAILYNAMIDYSVRASLIVLITTSNPFLPPAVQSVSKMVSKWIQFLARSSLLITIQLKGVFLVLSITHIS